MRSKFYPSGDFTISLNTVPPSAETGTVEWNVEFVEESEEEFVTDNGIRQAHKRRGLSGISSRGKKMVRSAAVLLEEVRSKQNLTFGTCTLPACDSAGLEKLNSNWSEICRQFFQELTRYLEKKGLPTDYVQVTEVQPKRLKERNEFALHLHWLCTGKKTRYEGWQIIPMDIRNIWQRIIINTLGYVVDCFASTRIEGVKYSVAKYLSKYVSKGSVLDLVDSMGISESQIPKAWYGISKNLKQAVNDNIIKCDHTQTEEFLLSIAELMNEGRVWIYEITIPLPTNDGEEKDVIVGYCGGFKNVDDYKSVMRKLQKENAQANGN
jgi:hypothetical protein